MDFFCGYAVRQWSKPPGLFGISKSAIMQMASVFKKNTLMNRIVNFTAAFVLDVVCLLVVWHEATVSLV